MFGVYLGAALILGSSHLEVPARGVEVEVEGANGGEDPIHTPPLHGFLVTLLSSVMDPKGSS